LRPYLDDTTNTWELGADGVYRRRTTPVGAAPFCAQEWLLSHAATGSLGATPHRE
jgi:hypothetical protein